MDHPLLITRSGIRHDVILPSHSQKLAQDKVQSLATAAVMTGLTKTMRISNTLVWVKTFARKKVLYLILRRLGVQLFSSSQSHSAVHSVYSSILSFY